MKLQKGTRVKNARKNMGMEIERKFTITKMPADLDSYDRHKISQAYLCENPTVRIRKQDDEYYMTYKSKGLLSRQEYNLDLTKEGFEHLLPKADGTIISKTRYLIPLENPRFVDGYAPAEDLELIIELDIFDAPFAPLVMAEIEFPDEECARAYIPEDWFDQDVTDDRRYYNSNMVYSKIL